MASTARALLCVALAALLALPARALDAASTSVVVTSQPEPTALLDADNPANCPDWLPDYAAWHAANRLAPDATYLVQYCPKGVKCLGIGDRTKGIMVLLRLAWLYKKVLIIIWDEPEPIVNYLTPNKIDWTTTGLPKDVMDRIHGEESTPFDIHLTENLGMMMQVIETGRHGDSFSSAKVVRVQSNLWYGMKMEGNQDDVFLKKFGRNQLGRCFYRFLFKMSANLEKMALTKLEEVYGNDPRPYTAWHWRLGGMDKERVLHRTNYHPGRRELEISRLQTMLAVLPCADSMTQEAGGKPLRDRPLLLVTDHNIMREWTAEGEFKSMTAMPARVRHVNYATLESYRDTWVDLAMLSMAKCFVYSRSGFSNVALWMGQSDCTQYLLTCVASATKLAQTPI